MLEDTITFREASRSNDMTLQGFDMSLMRIFDSLQNGESVANTPPAMVMSTANVTNASSNE